MKVGVYNVISVHSQTVAATAKLRTQWKAAHPEVSVYAAPPQFTEQEIDAARSECPLTTLRYTGKLLHFGTAGSDGELSLHAVVQGPGGWLEEVLVSDIKVIENV